jgi:hypothetical protein
MTSSSGSKPTSFSQALSVSVPILLTYSYRNSSLPHPYFLQASLIAGTTTDLIFYPLDTVKIRLQSKEGFLKNGGFRGVWKGVGSVIVGSGPGGESPFHPERKLSLCDLTWSSRLITAAAFFTTYEYLKRTLPQNIDILQKSPSSNHLVSSMGAEIVGRPSQSCSMSLAKTSLLINRSLS